MIKRKGIIIPAFNEDETILSVIEGIRRYSDADIVVIDDGSRDRTAEKAKTARATVIRHPFNMGYGVALQTGYKYAAIMNYDFLLQIDADGQHDPKYIPESFRQVETDSCDLVIGSRFLASGEYDAGTMKALGIKLFRCLIQLFTGEKITDPTSGYQCMNQKVYEVFTRDTFPSDYPDANIIIMLHRMGYRIKEIPVTMIPNPEGRSMHQGVLTLSYYFFNMFLSLFISLIRGKWS
ncbi:glycosyltransferase family 2 protein [Thermodesulfobacteriota bacterium]